MDPAAIRPTSADRPPDESATAVRLSAPVAANPWNRPAAISAAPNPASSRLGSLLTPIRWPKARAVRMPLAKLTTSRPLTDSHGRYRPRMLAAEAMETRRQFTDRRKPAPAEIHRRGQDQGDHYRDRRSGMRA